MAGSFVQFVDGLREARGLRKSKVYFQGFLTLVAAMTAANISAVTSLIHKISQLYRYHVIFLHIFSSSYIRGREGPVGAQRHLKGPSWTPDMSAMSFSFSTWEILLPICQVMLPWTELSQLLRHLASGTHFLRIWDLMTIWSYLIYSVQNILAYSLLILALASSHFPLHSFLLQLSLFFFNPITPSIQWNS